MQDRIATMLIIRSLQDIANELKAVHHELRQLNRSSPHEDAVVSPGFSDQSEMDNAFEILEEREEEGR